jgi:hypothetical protein
MSSRYSPAQAVVVDQDNRNMARGLQGVLPMSQEINDLWSEIDGGSLGIQSNAIDVDSLCLGGGEFTVDPTLTTGLTFAMQAGRLHYGQNVVTYAPSTLALAASATNYVEADSNGNVYTNTTAFTVGRCRLYVVITGASTITSWTSAKVLLAAPSNAAITGAQLSTPGATKTIVENLGSISGTTTFTVIAPVTGTITGVTFVTNTTVAANNTNYWTWAVTDVGSGGVGTQALLNAGAVNTTQSTGGSGTTALVPRALTLSGTLNVTAGDVLTIVVTATGAPTTMTSCSIAISESFTN